MKFPVLSIPNPTCTVHTYKSVFVIKTYIVGTKYVSLILIAVKITSPNYFKST